MCVVPYGLYDEADDDGETHAATHDPHHYGCDLTLDRHMGSGSETCSQPGNTHTHTHRRTDTYTHIHTDARTRTHTYTHIHIYIHTHTHTHTYTHTHTHTFTHTHTHAVNGNPFCSLGP